MYLGKDNYIWKKSIPVVYDLEYSGNLTKNLAKNCSIWEIAAKSGTKTFYCLINPYMSKDIVHPPVHERYKMPTKEEFEKKNAVSFEEGFTLFIVFLNSLLVAEDQHILLMSHNGFRGDKPVLENEIMHHELAHKILHLKLYFFDTLYFIRKQLPSLPSYSISKLYFTLFQEKMKEEHTAMGDVQALEKILKYIRKPYEGAIFMLFLTPFSNINGIGTVIQNRFFTAGFTCLEHFFYLNGFSISNIINGLIINNIIVDNTYKLNCIATEMFNYGSMKLVM